MASKTARHLRGNATDAEKRLWAALRRQQVDGLRFRRQVPIGKFVVDFASYSARLVVEVDGGQHVERRESDLARTRWLENHGFHVIRFWNNEVLENLDGVLEVFREAATQESPPHPNPTPPGGREQ